MRLTKREKEGFEFLRDLAEAYLNGSLENIDGNDKNWQKVKEIGFTVKLVNHKQVKRTKVGKSEGIKRTLTNGKYPSYIRGKATTDFLPFQVAEYKKSPK